MVFLYFFLSSLVPIITQWSANVRILKKISFGCVCVCVFFTNLGVPKLFNGLGIEHQRRMTIPLWNSPGNIELFMASLYVWYLQYCALCDDLVDFKLRAGVRYTYLFCRHSTTMYFMKEK